MTKKYFTRKEANELLPTLEKELVELQELQKGFQYKWQALKQVKEATVDHLKTETEKVFKLESELEFLDMQAKLHVQNIQASGVELKGIDLGLLDFPALINGEEVLLCWRQGESEITHYHGTDEGFAGRKPLDEQ